MAKFNTLKSSENIYYDDISIFPVLTNEEETELFHLYNSSLGVKKTATQHKRGIIYAVFYG